VIVETDASDHALVAIISICTGQDIHPIAFHSRAFSSTKLNYDIYDKELFAIFEAFKKWHHYLEGTITPVEVFTDHKNLTYSKALSHHQARWSEFLSQFNLSIKFCPGRLGTKPDVLTQRWDIYNKKGQSLLTNTRPLFSKEQMDQQIISPNPCPLELHAAVTIDSQMLLDDIRMAIRKDPTYLRFLETGKGLELNRWSRKENGLILHDNWVFVLDNKDLRLHVLKSKHDHKLAGHPGQSKTFQLVQRHYSWPNLKSFVTDYIRSCNACSRNKSRRHKPYSLLKQLPIPSQPWESISMDFIE